MCREGPFSSVAQSGPTLCNPINRSMPGLPVHHLLPESTQTLVHWVGDAIQPPHLLSSPSPPALNLSQHHGLFKWVSSCHQVAKVLEFQLQHQSFQWTPRIDLISFRMDWLDLLAVQGPLKSLLQRKLTLGNVCLRFSAPLSLHTTAVFAWRSRGECLIGTLMPSCCPFLLRALLLWDLPFLWASPLELPTCSWSQSLRIYP